MRVFLAGRGIISGSQHQENFVNHTQILFELYIYVDNAKFMFGLVGFAEFWQLSLTFVNKNPVVPGHVLMRKVARLKDLRRRLFKEMDGPGILQRYISKSGFCVLKTAVCLVICKLHMTKFMTEAHNFYFIFLD